jgi:hypothetical protein
MPQDITYQDAIALIKSVNTPLENDILKQLKFVGDVNVPMVVYNGNTELEELAVGEEVVIVNGNLTQ